MKKLLLTGLVVALALAATSSRLPAQTKATVTNVPTIPHEAVPNFFKNPPGIYTGENMGIATNSKGNVYIFHRANETRLFEYTPQGVFIREIGRGVYSHAFAHSVRVDAQDNIWTVDEGTDMLTKFSPEGKVLLTIGRREDPIEMLGNMPGQGRFHGRNAGIDSPRDRRRVRSTGQHLRATDLTGAASTTRTAAFVKAVGKQGRANPNSIRQSPPISRATSTLAIVTRVQVLDNDPTGSATCWATLGGVGRSWTEESWQSSSTSQFMAGQRRPRAEITGEVYKVDIDAGNIGQVQAGKAVASSRRSTR